MVYEIRQIPGIVMLLCLVLSNVIVLPIIIAKGYEKRVFPFFAFSVSSIVFYLVLAVVPFLLFFLLSTISQTFISRVLNLHINDVNDELFTLPISYLMTVAVDYFAIKKTTALIKRKMEQVYPISTITCMPIVKVYSVATAICSVEVAIMVGVTILLIFFK